MRGEGVRGGEGGEVLHTRKSNTLSPSMSKVRQMYPW